jgi:hypothetical protein
MSFPSSSPSQPPLSSPLDYKSQGGRRKRKLEEDVGRNPFLNPPLLNRHRMTTGEKRPTKRPRHLGTIDLTMDEVIDLTGISDREYEL